MTSARHPVFAKADAWVDALAAARPATATIWGVPGHDHRWDDLSPEGWQDLRSVLAHLRAEVDTLPAAHAHWDTLALEVARDHFDRELAALDREDFLGDLNHLVSPFQLIPLTLAHTDCSTAQGFEAVRARLDGIPVALEGYQRTLALGLDRGRAAAARQVRSVIAQGHTMAASRCFAPYAAQAADAGHPAGLVGDLDRAGAHAQAAYAELTRWLETTYLPRASTKDGVGPDRYAPAAEAFLHVQIDLDATLDWGWQEVHRLHDELKRSLADAAPGSTLAEAVQRWAVDPHTSAADPAAFLGRIHAWQAEAMDTLATDLPMPTALRTLSIEAAPAGSPPGAWYVGPSEDLSRPGSIRYSFVGDGPIPLFDQQSTAYHEGFPGHHLQIGLQRTLGADLTRLHRVAYDCTGFSEGWALYAEHLMDERGFYTEPAMRIGMLVNQIARACRVVLDIGLHLDRPIPRGACFEPGEPWTFERAVRFMTAIGGLRPEVAESEVLRYLGWPGQAISYKVGQRVLLELRAGYLQREGKTLAGFHRELLGSGSVGLGLARRLLAA